LAAQCWAARRDDFGQAIISAQPQRHKSVRAGEFDLCAAFAVRTALAEERLDAHRAPTKGNNFLSQLIIMGISACVVCEWRGAVKITGLPRHL
jgi:hypothetical protein